MKKASKLVQLISSLTKNEKRYVVFNMKQGLVNGKNNSYVLYKEIDRSLNSATDVTEEDLKKQLKTKSIPESSFFVTKHQCYHAILKYMKTYHAEGNNKNDLNNEIYDVKFLLQKRMLNEAYSLLNKIEKKARQTEMFTDLITILNLKISIICQNHLLENKLGSIRDITDEIQNTLQQQANYFLYRKISAELTLIFKINGEARNNKKAQVYLDYLKNNMLWDEKCALSIRAKMTFNFICAVIGFGTNNYNELEIYVRRQLELLEKNNYLYQNQLEFIYCMYNNLVASLMTNNDEDFFTVLSKFKAIKPDNLANLILIEEKYYNLNFVWSYRNKDNKRFTKTLDEYKKFIETHQDLIDLESKVLNNYIISLYYFMRGRFNTALLWNNKNINCTSDSHEIRTEVLFDSKIFELFIQYELGNMDLIENRTRALLRRVTQSTHLSEIRLEVIKMFKKVAISSGVENHRAIFLKTKDNINHIILENSYEKKYLEDFNVLEWLDSK